MLEREEATSEEPIKQMTGPEFVRRFKRDIEDCEDSRFVFFIGAGCSISSGIPDAKNLVKIWLRRLKNFRTGDEDGHEEWARQEFEGYDENHASRYYSKVIKELFLNPETRQQEIESLTEGKDPGFGYAVLANLMAHEDYRGHCNAVLTVNFDDLIADALYLYTKKKPLVIVHDSLVGFVRSTRRRPMILKLHGDARLDPKNTESETRELGESVKKALKSLLAEAGLIFVGYGGHDESIINILNDLPKDALPWGIYWINNELPEAPIKKWLIDRRAVWVNHLDFDELMLLIRNEFNFRHPEETRFTKLTETYWNTFERLQKQLGSKSNDATSKALSESLDKAIDDAGTSWWGVLADAAGTSDPDIAERKYAHAIEKFPNSIIFASYARFLNRFRKDYDKAEKYYKDALELDPDNAVIIADYANFLWQIRKDYDKAEEYCKKALKLNPDNADVVRLNANFLWQVRKDNDRAEEYYKAALKLNPNRTSTMDDYGTFLWKIRKDDDKAEEYYKKVLKLDPDNAYNQSNYAGFLLARGDKEGGFGLMRKASDLNRNNPNPPLMVEMQFYKFAHSEDNDSRKASLSQIKALLEKGVRSPKWDLSRNAQRAIEDGHPCPEFLSQLAKVISDEVDIKSLDRFDAWAKEEGC